MATGRYPLTRMLRKCKLLLLGPDYGKGKVLPFGMTSAPATFQQLMKKVQHGLHWKSLLLYLDDIIVIARHPLGTIGRGT